MPSSCRSRRFWLWSCVFGVVASSSIFATDFTDWLGRRQWRVVGNATNGVVIEDINGRRYRLWNGDSTALKTELAAAVLAKALGVASVPVFPTLVRKDGARWAPVDETLAAEAAVPVLVRPEVVESPFGDERLRSERLAELAVALLHRYLLAPSGPTTLRGDGATFSLVRDHVAPGRFTDAFTADRRSPAEVFSAVFAAFPLGTLAQGTWHDRDRVLTALNVALSRLEKLDDGAWDAIVGPALDALGSTASRRALLMTRVRDARVLTQTYFSAAEHQQSAQLATAVAVDTPIVRLPPTAPTFDGQTPSLDWLWNLWLDGARTATPLKAMVPKQHPKRVRFGRDVPSTAKNALATIVDVTDSDMSRIYVVLPHRSPRFLDRKADRVPQLSLWSGNEDTLIVVPLNDPEAELIAAMAEESGARVLALPKRDYPHGSKLDDRLKGMILDEYKKKPFTRLAVAELPGRPLSVETSLAEDGRFRFQFFDHHTYKTDNLYRHRAEGSAEQAADFLGFELSPTDAAIAYVDKSFIFGALEAGFTPASLAAIVAELPAEIASLGEGIASAVGPIFLLDSFAGKIPDAASALAVKHAPRIPNILIVEPHQIRFSGNPRFEAKLTKAFDALEKRQPGVEHYTFGDPFRSVGWGYKQIADGYRAEAFATLKAVVADVAGTEGTEALALLLRQPMDFGTMTVDERFRLNDGPRRAAALRAIDWNQLSGAERDRCVALAVGAVRQELEPGPIEALFGDVSVPKYSSYDFTVFVELAESSQDPRWRPFLEAAQSAWMTRFAGWHKVLGPRVEAILPSYPAALPADGVCAKEMVQ